MKKYRCKKDLFMNESNRRVFTAGKEYVLRHIKNGELSFHDDDGIYHSVSEDWLQCFIPVPDKVYYAKLDEMNGNHMGVVSYCTNVELFDRVQELVHDYFDNVDMNLIFEDEDFENNMEDVITPDGIIRWAHDEYTSAQIILSQTRLYNS